MVSRSRQLLAWGVHLFTSLGLLFAFLALIAIDSHDWRQCFIWLIVCFIIDSVDGSLARKFQVSEVLPHMDGKAIDYVIDFATYAIIPVYFFYRAEMVAAHLMNFSVAIMLLSAALYYGKKNMVADNQYFIGFPVLWNFVVFFQFFIFQNNSTLNFISVILFGILHFVPIRYAYPSMTKKYFWSHLIISVVGIYSALYVLYLYPGRNVLFEAGTIIGGAYFALFAIFDTFKKQKEFTR